MVDSKKYYEIISTMKVETSARLVCWSSDRGQLVAMTRSDSGSVKFFGGRVKPTEDPMDAVVREAREEGGIDLAKYNSNFVALPYQSNDPERPSFRFGVGMPASKLLELEPRDDVAEILVTHISDVGSRLTYPLWKAHWENQLLPVIQNLIR